MNKKQVDYNNPYFNYFKILFESFEKNLDKTTIGEYHENEDSSENKSKEFESYITNFLKEKLDGN